MSFWNFRRSFQLLYKSNWCVLSVLNYSGKLIESSCNYLQKIFCYFSEPVTKNLCEPSPCGPHSLCREINGHAVCVCVQGYIGNPPNCRPECTVSSDCPLNQACSNQKCIDPCPGACGRNTHCVVVKHNPVCRCLSGFSGDPFSVCQRIRKYIF